MHGYNMTGSPPDGLPASAAVDLLAGALAANCLAEAVATSSPTFAPPA